MCLCKCSMMQECQHNVFFSNAEQILWKIMTQMKRFRDLLALFVPFTFNDTLVPLYHHETKTTQMNLLIIISNSGLLQLESTIKVC